MLGPAELLLPPLTIAGSVLSLPFAPLFNAHKYGIRHAWFKAFWTWFGPATRPIFAPSVRPLLATCSGVVVDVGPGDGVWLAEFAKAVKACSGRITKIYGIEPNPLLHARLAKAVKEHGLQDVYVPICARIQDLEKHGIARGSIDTIVTVHVLCSVGDRVDAISKELYTYLKPGGTWQVFEHVAARTAPIRIWQGINNIVWPALLDGCDLTRDTEKVLKAAGPWEKVELHMDPREGWFQPIPHVVGTLVK